MEEKTLSRTKIIRITFIVSLFTFLAFLLLTSDSFIDKIYFYKRTVSKPCILCPLPNNATHNSGAGLVHYSVFLKNNAKNKYIEVALFFSHADTNLKLRNKLKNCLSSLFNHSSVALNLHILTDPTSVKYAVQVLKETVGLIKTSAKISMYDINVLMTPLQDLINTLRPHFSYKQGSYYSDGLFYLSIGLFKVMNFKKLILVDADVKFLDDVKSLHNYFSMFPAKALVGIAKEQQPVYRHVLHEYRRLHNDTQVGGPPPNGHSGFNSGVLLLDFEKMRNSSLYLSLVNNLTLVLELVEKYKFKGHLGDQDFYTLVSFDYPYLFFELPCTWNRQLCQWWKHHGYKDIFDKYYLCMGKVHLLHGNCNSALPYF